MIIRRIARPLLASIFVVEGFDALRHPGGRAEVAEPVIDLMDRDVVQPAAQKVAAGAAAAADRTVATAGEMADVADDPQVREGAGRAADAAAALAQPVREASVGGIDLDSATYVRVNGAVQLGAGLLLATGRAPRLASTALAASLVPTTIAGHRWWEQEGEVRRTQRIQFLKNLGLFGGLILAAVDTEGRPDLIWRARHRRDHDGGDHPQPSIADAAKAASGAATGARHLARSAKEQAGAVAAETAPMRHDLAERAGTLAHHLADRAHELAPQVREAAGDARDRAAELSTEVRAKAAEVAPQVREAAADLAPQAHALGARVGDSLASVARS